MSPRGSTKTPVSRGMGPKGSSPGGASLAYRGEPFDASDGVGVGGLTYHWANLSPFFMTKGPQKTAKKHQYPRILVT